MKEDIRFINKNNWIKDMRKEGMNKRAQDLSITTLILIALGIIVLVIIILGFTKGWNFVFGKFDLVPGQDLQTVVSACGIAGQAGLSADYCNTFREIEIGGEKKYVNCEYGQVWSNLKEDEKLDTGCGTADEKSSVQVNYCLSLMRSGKADSDTKVNDLACASLTCKDDLKGEELTKADRDAGSNCELKYKTEKLTKTIQKGFKAESDGAYCCVAQ